MKIKFHKSGRIADTEIIITCDSSVHSSLAAIEVNDFVKAAALKLARDVKTLVGELREKDKKSYENIVDATIDALGEKK